MRAGARTQPTWPVASFDTLRVQNRVVSGHSGVYTTVVVTADGSAVGRDSVMLDTVSAPNAKAVSKSADEATSCSVTLCPGRRVAATMFSGMLMVCVLPLRVTGIGVT